jgi:hypothetical protein
MRLADKAVIKCKNYIARFINHMCELIVYENLSLVKGLHIKDALGVKDGPVMGKINDMILRFQYRFPQKGKDEILAYLQERLTDLSLSTEPSA